MLCIAPSRTQLGLCGGKHRNLTETHWYPHLSITGPTASAADPGCCPFSMRGPAILSKEKTTIYRVFPKQSEHTPHITTE